MAAEKGDGEMEDTLLAADSWSDGVFCLCGCLELLLLRMGRGRALSKYLECVNNADG